MGAMSRRKGANGERAIASAYRAKGFDVDRVPNSGGLKVKGDLKANDDSLDGLHLEVKRQEKIQLNAWLKQAAEEASAGEVPIVIHRRSRSPWYATLPFDDLLDMQVQLRDLQKGMTA